MRRLLFVLAILFINNIYSQTFNIDSVIKNFKGYKVPNNVKSLGANYWKRNTPVMKDLIIQAYQKPLSFSQIANQQNCIQGGWGGSICGDFNNDGWIDVFTPGGIDSASYKDRNRGVGFSFLLWDTINKSFKDTNLVNQKSLEVLISAMKAVPVYLNSDNYVDIVIFPGDDAIAPVKLMVSDGKGGYDYSEIITNENDTYPSGVPGGKPTIFKGSGDVDDLNGDGNPDIYISGNNFAYILWGLNSYPYFDSKNHPKFVYDTSNFPGFNNNGFGEICINCTNSFGGVIADVNNDGKNDLIVYGANATEDKIILNQGSGRFNDKSVVSIPRYIPQGDGGDYLLMDLNNDGLKDFVTVTGGGMNGKNSYNNIYAVIQKQDHSFQYDTSMIQFSTSFKTKFLGGSGGSGTHLFNYDFNNDGKMDIGYINSAWGDDCGLYDSLSNRGNILPFKTVFINENNKYVEKDYYQYDLFAKAMLEVLKKRFLCIPMKLQKPTYNTSNFTFCSGDSIKLSITNVNKDDKFKWYSGPSIDSISGTSKNFNDNAILFVTRTDATNCVISSDTVQIKKLAKPSAPTISRDTTNNLVANANNLIWYKDGTAISDTAQRIKPTAAGSYTAKTTQNGCTSTMSNPYYYLVTDIINLNADEFIKLAPNPFNSYLNFDFAIKSYQRLNLEVYEITSGLKVASRQNLIAGNKINLGELASGIYILKVSSQDNKISYQFKMVKL